MYIVGGGPIPANAQRDTEFYNPQTNAWSPGPQLPIDLGCTKMVFVQGSVFALGGCISYANVYTGRVFQLRLETEMGVISPNQLSWVERVDMEQFPYMNQVPAVVYDL